jgi:small subunit ribosomal protein S8
LKDEGFIGDYEMRDEDGKAVLKIQLKYYEGRPVIEKIGRISKPGRRTYSAKDALPSVLGGMGVAIVSTSKGIMTDRNARKEGVGGEVLCYVY